MKQSYASAQRTIAFLIIVGSVVGSHGSSSSSSPQSSYSRQRVRSMTSSSMQFTNHRCKKNNKSLSQSSDVDSVPSPIILTSSTSTATNAASVILCSTRGGAIDDDPQRRRGRYDYERDGDRLPPRRSSPDDWEGRGDRRERPAPRPRGDSRGSDPRRGGGPRTQMDRDRRYNNIDERSDRSREFRGDGRRDYYDERNRQERDPRKYEPSNVNGDSGSDDGKSKKWFSLKKDKSESPLPNKVGKDENEQLTGSDTSWDSTSGLPPPPPPPPPPTDSTFTSSSGVEINPAETERTPIHYMFPTAEAAAEERKMKDNEILDDEMMMDRKDGAMDTNEPDIPFLEVDEDYYADRERGSLDSRRRRRKVMDDEDENFRASPRRDAVTIFMSTRRGALKVRVGSMIVGAALGGFLGKSLMNDPVVMSIAMSSLLFLTGFLRNDYGELSRALGLAFVFTLQRTSSVRKEYPTLPHIKAMIRQSQRKPFPPVEDGESPWKYEPIYRDDPDFKMTYALLAMALVGSFCGGNVPILPAWMGGIAGALVFASLTTGANARGDLGRSMGMRVVGLVQLILAINSELRILGKAATVSGLIFDKIMIMDRKHRIKDRIVAISKWGYDKISRTAEQVKEDMEERPERR